VAPGTAAAPCGWSCPRCTYMEEATSQTCSMCGTCAEPVQPEPAPAAVTATKAKQPKAKQPKANQPKAQVAATNSTPAAAAVPVDSAAGSANSSVSSAAAAGEGQARNTSKVKEAKYHEMAQTPQRVQNNKMAAEQAAALAAREAAGKPRINMVVVGHVDAGKSTMMGRLLVDLGQVSQKLVHKYEKEAKAIGKGSFSFAWVLDQQEAERARGVTIDVAIQSFETESRMVTLLDAPGHKDYIPNMISGAAQADVAVLVVNSLVGEFEAGFSNGGQTREHAQLLKSLGVRELVVAVNKLELLDWDQSRFDFIQAELTPFLTGRTVGFKAKQLTFVPVSGLTGHNLATPGDAPELVSWYADGLTLLQAIDQLSPPARKLEVPTRLCVTDVFKSATNTMGSAFAGKLESGTLRVGDKVAILPSLELATVKGLELDGAAVEWGFAGDNLDVGITGVELSSLAIGDVMCDPQQMVRMASKFEAQIAVLQLEGAPILPGQPISLFMQGCERGATFTKLIAILGKGGEVVQKKPRCVRSDQMAQVQIKVDQLVCMEEFATSKMLGRFMLRQAGATVAVGIITRVRS